MLRSLLLSAPSSFLSSKTALTKSWTPLPTKVATPMLSGIVRQRPVASSLARFHSSTSTSTLNSSTLPVLLFPAISVSSSSFQESKRWWTTLATATAATILLFATADTATTMTQCESDEEDDTEEDPYDNLPEQDEPTHCSICLTYRQGPCRPYWRKVEACTKDNELKKSQDQEEDEDATTKNDNDNNNSGNSNDSTGDHNDGTSDNDDDDGRPDPPCLKYMLPWIDCATGYRNLYALIELDTNYTMGIAELENEATLQACWAPSTEPSVDWTAWQEYVASHTPQWKLPKRQRQQKKDDNEQNVALWKTLGTEKDPELVEIRASVPTKQGKGIIECAYALDQDGHVLGFSYGTKPSEVAVKQAKQDSNDDDDEEEENYHVELKIRLLPLHTRSITIAAAYTQPIKDGAKETEPLESHIFKSRPFSLKKMSQPQPSEP